MTQGHRKLRNVVAYDPKADRWSQLTSLPQGRSSSVSSVIGGTLYVTTGAQGGPQTTTWAGRWRSR